MKAGILALLGEAEVGDFGTSSMVALKFSAIPSFLLIKSRAITQFPIRLRGAHAE
jgi:hypothetical protein